MKNLLVILLCMSLVLAAAAGVSAQDEDFDISVVNQMVLSTDINALQSRSYNLLEASTGQVLHEKNSQIRYPMASLTKKMTTYIIIQEIEKKGPESVKICALIEKLERQDIKIPIDYCGFRIKEGFIIGYGLDFDEKYRNLPDLYVLR